MRNNTSNKISVLLRYKLADIKKSHRIVTIIVLGVIVSVLLVAVTKRYQSVASTAMPKTVAGAIRLDDLSWQYVPSEKAMTPPLDGYTYISVDVSLANIAKTATWFAPVLQSYVKDTQDRHYGIEIVELQHPFEGKTYASGEVAKGQLAYLVPKNDRLQWCYDVSSENHPVKPLCMVLDKQLLKQ